MCQNWAVGRSPGCSATVLCCKELGAALGCPREPAGKGTGQDPVVVIRVAEHAPLTGEQVKPSLMTP